MVQHIKNALPIIFIVVFASIMYGLTLRGDVGLDGSLLAQEEYEIRRGGPYEGSNSSSRYALTKAIADYDSIFLNDELALLASPDLVYYNQKFFSIFTPGVSFLGVPFYMFGNYFGVPQIMTYISTFLFALLNLFLIAKIAQKLGAERYASYFAGLVFVFGTNAFPYALTFTQHHLSTALILLASLNAFSAKNWQNNILFGIIFGAGLFVDIPNGFLMLPILIYVLFKNFDVISDESELRISMRWKIFGLLVGVVPLFYLLGLYNFELTGSYLTLPQAIGRVSYQEVVAENQSSLQEQSEDSDSASVSGVLKLDNLPRGLYTLLISFERSWFFYSPIVLIGLLGLFFIWKIDEERKKHALVLFNVIAINILVYCMFGDPWGGWSFGPRYLIPATAIAAICASFAISRLKRNYLFNTILIPVVIYGILISFLGALTTNNVPPAYEAVNLPEPIPYTYEYNWQLLQAGESGALAYNIYFSKHYSAQEYYQICSAFVILFILIFYFAYCFKKDSGLSNSTDDV